ncbi:MAG: RT0821/Lpp0805 family surface protein [Gammaproteobacteria bacterium]|nr:RT0821/Lpp0805 family surface protein [Gammaproteobacteria bacterium]
MSTVQKLTFVMTAVCLLVSSMAVVAEECQGNKEAVGTVVGALLGGIVGSQIGKGSGKKAATVLGVVAGGYAGNRYGESLDCKDQQYHSQTAHEALEYQPAGRPSSWKNPDSGHSGSITPVKTWQRDNGQYCRDYTQSIVVDGKVEEANGTACRGDDGSWQIVSNQPETAPPDFSDSTGGQERF